MSPRGVVDVTIDLRYAMACTVGPRSVFTSGSTPMQRIDDFEIVREIGRGAMGVVYEAVERPLDRRVALKILNEHHARQLEASARFTEEARAVAQLAHPCIMRVYRLGRFDHQLYLALEYVDGVALDHLLATERISMDRALAILTAVASALGHAHAAGVVHRDVKPGNILVEKSGRVVVGDFGIAKRLDNHVALTRAGQMVGTPAYMSPEQITGGQVSPASDVYALGIVAFELLTARVPFTADTAISLLMKHVNDPPPRLDPVRFPLPLVELVDRMLAKNPALRPRDGAEVEQALRAIVDAITPGSDVSPLAATMLTTQPIECAAPVTSVFREQDITAVCFELRGFSQSVAQDMLPDRAAFVLESWLRLVTTTIRPHGGTFDRNVADKVTALFGYPEAHPDHANRALAAALSMRKALDDFNRAHDLHFRMRVGMACGPALVGRVVGDVASTTAAGMTLREMAYLTKLNTVDATLRITRAMYRRVGGAASFVRLDDPKLGEIWVLD